MTGKSLWDYVQLFQNSSWKYLLQFFKDIQLCCDKTKLEVVIYYVAWSTPKKIRQKLIDTGEHMAGSLVNRFYYACQLSKLKSLLQNLVQKLDFFHIVSNLKTQN